jgi:hypothetical protein
MINIFSYQCNATSPLHDHYYKLKTIKARHSDGSRNPVSYQPILTNNVFANKRVAFGWIPIFIGMTEFI